MNFLLQIAIGLVMSVIAYALMPKPKKPKPPAVKDMEGPTADAGRPIPVVFGSVEVQGLNVLWYGDKKKDEGEVEV